MLGQTAFERLSEFHLDTLKHPLVDPKNLFQHLSLSRPAGQALSKKQWEKVARLFLKQIGAEGVHYVVTRHSNTDNDHIHIVFSRSLVNGKLLSLSNQRWKWRAALRQVEEELDISVAEWPRLVDTPTSDSMVNAQKRAARLRASDPHISRAAVFRALAQSVSHDQFTRHLKAAGIEVRYAEKNGKTTGLIFRKAGANEFLAGSSVDRSFSLKNVQVQIELNRLSLQRTEQEFIIRRNQQFDLKSLQRLNFERDI